jgi:hypothetical protein
MNLPLPRRTLTSRAFWFMVSTTGRIVGRLWREPVDYVPMVERVTIPIAHLPDGLRGLTIAHLSDFHASRYTHPDAVRRAAQMAMALQPDLIVLTGDFVHRQLEFAALCADALADLRAPLGVYGVLGNHDYSNNHRIVIKELTRVGLAPMRNESRRIPYHGTEFYLLGVDDARYHQADLTRALNGVPTDAFKIMLVHEPDFVDYVPRHAPPIALQLSGHSHGGQIRLPLIGSPLLPTLGRKYPLGLKRAKNGTWVYTTRGIGLGSPPVRYNCPAEISLLKLISQKDFT